MREDNLDAVGRLEAIEAIRSLKSKYLRALDAKDWETFASLFTDDAVQDLTTDPNMALIPDGYNKTTTGDGHNVGGPEIARWVDWCVGNATTVHHAMMPDIDITGSATATGIWSFTDFLHWPQQPIADAIRSSGYYIEEYRKVGEVWRISRSCITRALGVSSGAVAPIARD